MSNTPNPTEFDAAKAPGASPNMRDSERMDLELKILASYFRGPQLVQKQILAKLQPAAYVYIENVWKSVLNFVAEGVSTPDLSVIAQAGMLSDMEIGFAEGSFHESPVETIEEADILVFRIHEQYYRDVLVESISSIGSKLTSNSEYDSTRARIELQEKLEQIAATMDDGGEIGVGLGYDPTAVAALITTGTSSQIIPTGFDGFDRQAQGIAKGELHICACPSSGGKTTIMNQLCLNMGLGMKDRQYVREPMSVFYVSLEMSQREMWGRMVANLSGIPISRFRSPELLTEDEIALINETLKNMSEHLAGYGHMFRFENAEYGNIDAITRVLATHAFDVVIVDYLNLMADGESLWSSMGSIARSLKLLAQKRNFACITAAQLDEDSLKIRYSRMVKEHCDTIWLWQPSGGIRDASDEVVSAFTEIFVDKGRNIGKFSFWVHFDFAHMIVSSVNPITELGLNGSAPSAQTQRLPMAGAPTLALPNNTMGQNNMATQILSSAINQSILTPPMVGTADASAGFGANIPGSVPKSISQGAAAFESDGDTAVYGDNDEGEAVKTNMPPKPGTLTPPMGASPMATKPGAPTPPNTPKGATAPTPPPSITPTPTAVNKVNPDEAYTDPDSDIPWNQEVVSEAVVTSIAADEITPADNDIEL
ncbi:DnaB-like helicase C-terminal domain-containing protein [Ewingella americana]|uniref:SF4 helicase domain-containing protein n=1 Tax=Ewingella americana TaxID=41202 RepID=A0A502GEP3_9GAMM|nr:DnaB-like helicase C-terminal domain-containing protein [Ewingella americana]TPG60008.1 hypothetical protein EAH77_15690 [Ewingella americana]